ncbi:MAG: hypothetical protein N2Z74_09065 [Syntrophales bacterium]|nr:hypothetical protein [Syntrophales bacterium]
MTKDTNTRRQKDIARLIREKGRRDRDVLIQRKQRKVKKKG